mgnify:FL=1
MSDTAIENTLYVVYTSQGVFIGFYDDIEAINSILQENNEYIYKPITREIRDFILSEPFNPAKDILFNMNFLTSEVNIIDDKKYLLQEYSSAIIDMEKIKNKMCKNIKTKCGEYITSGLSIQLSDGSEKDFTYSLEDQINIKSFVDNFKSGDMLVYHGTGEMFNLYSYDDILKIYKELENNKIYNLIYTSVLCQYIMKEYTEEMYCNKEIIGYGYSNEQILKEVNTQYEAQLLK